VEFIGGGVTKKFERCLVEAEIGSSLLDQHCPVWESFADKFLILAEQVLARVGKATHLRVLAKLNKDMQN
jgi:hypothetical protein